MARYYSLEQIKSAVKITHEKYGGMTEEFDLLKLLQMPTADVAPVKHGKWIYGENDYDDSTFYCSICGEPWTLIAGTPRENNMHYCPNCGAKMEGDQDA